MSTSPETDRESWRGDDSRDSSDRDSAEARHAFRSALGRYSASRLRAILPLRGLEETSSRPTAVAAELTEQLDSPAAVASLLARLGHPERLALGLFAAVDSTIWPWSTLSDTLRLLDVDPRSSLLRLLEPGLVAIEAPWNRDPIADFETELSRPASSALRVRIHPTVAGTARVRIPAGTLPRTAAPVSQVREADGLEAILRLAVLWQRVAQEPLRQTQHGTVYKRDRERLRDDPALVDPITDSLASMPDLFDFWLFLGRRMGLIRQDRSTDRLRAAPFAFWDENAVHLPQMIATAWLGMQPSSAIESPRATGSSEVPAAGSLRLAAMLWLASLPEQAWVALEELERHLADRDPRWQRLSSQESAGGRTAPRLRDGAARSRGDGQQAAGSSLSRSLTAALLGAGYVLGLVRSGIETPSGKKVVQLTPLGRYALAQGPPPPPRPVFDHFLVVQPNFEIIAYREGLTPRLIGELSRFASWSRIGSALELKLCQESILLGLEQGQIPETMIETLARHSQKPLPGAVVEAIRHWADRRDRVSFYLAATLVEFASRADRDRALEEWEGTEPGVRPRQFTPVADRYLLAEDPQAIPAERIRTSGARDYRNPPEPCVAVAEDGVTLTLDPDRSDLLIDSELSRLADEQPLPYRPRGGLSAPPPRCFRVSPASLSRALELGMSHTELVEWFLRRTGKPLPPAIALLLAASSPKTQFTLRPRLVLTAPCAELLDGLLQHPATRELLGERLGPTAVIVPASCAQALGDVLGDLGLAASLDLPASESTV
jgi:hypothetical protein